METPTVINFKKINNVDIHLLDIIANKMNEQTYNAKEGFGYILRSHDPTHILGFLILDYPTYTSQFDPNEMVIKKEKIIRKLFVEFLIDIEYNLIEIYSDKNNVTRVINEIGKLSEYSISIDDVYFKAYDVINRLNNQKIKYEIKNLRIQDFSINKFTIGSFFVKVLENHEGLRLIKEYNPTITYLGLNLSIDNNEISLGLYESGALRIYNRFDESIEIICALKKILF